MARGELDTIFGRLRRLAAEPADSTDAQLLRRFIGARDAAAFELLVWRHGGMVLDLCRRLLRHEADAEDAFQATFLTLARKAAAVARGAALGGWLYTVARRTALAARARSARRAAHERPLADL